MSWDELVTIRRDAARERELELSSPPVACPNDGEPLAIGTDGVRFCRFDGWRADGTGP